MSRTQTSALSPMQKIARNPAVIALTLALALAGCANKKNMPNSAGELGLGGGAGSATPGSQQDFTVNVGDRIFFDTDSTSIRADAQQTLQRQAQWLARYPNYAITVEGHADERGTREYNLALGARRAAATKEFLASQGVPANRIDVRWVGEREPPVATANGMREAQNRVVEVAID